MIRRSVRFIVLVGFFMLFLLSSRSGTAQPVGLFFSNQTNASGLKTRHETPLTPQDRGSLMMGGAAAGDFNQDGWTDLFVIGGGLRADQLYINQQDNTFVDVAQAAGLAKLHVGSGVAVADYNGDGWLDIFVTSHGPPQAPAPGHHMLYRNNRDGTYTDVAYTAGVNRTSPEIPDGYGATFGDYDLDGDLDLFVAGWAVIRDPAPRSALGNRLFRNNGDETFTDVTETIDIGDDIVHGYTPCFADMDGDRYPELLLAADFGSSRYFVNNRDGTFARRDIYAGSKPEDAMGAAVADFNGDGRPDWYVSEIHDDSGSGRGTGNKLFTNQGDHTYLETGIQAGISDGGWGWGTVAVDLNQDGWLDIVETNGWPLPAYENELSKVWINDTTGVFREQAESLGLIHRLHGLGVVQFDAENDGDMDIAITAAKDEFNFYRNELQGPNTNWLRIALDRGGGSHIPPNGIGSRIAVKIGTETYVRWILACPSYISQSELIAHFGLGAATAVDAVEVTWPDGVVTTLRNVAPNQTLNVLYDQTGRIACIQSSCTLFLPILWSNTKK